MAVRAIQALANCLWLTDASDAIVYMPSAHSHRRDVGNHRRTHVTRLMPPPLNVSWSACHQLSTASSGRALALAAAVTVSGPPNSPSSLHAPPPAPLPNQIDARVVVKRIRQPGGGPPASRVVVLATVTAQGGSSHQRPPRC